MLCLYEAKRVNLIVHKINNYYTDKINIEDTSNIINKKYIVTKKVLAYFEDPR